MTRLFSFVWTFRTFIAVVSITGVPVQGQQQVVVDSYPPVTSVEQGESILLVCRVVGVLSSARPDYSWTCKGAACTGSEVVNGNRLSIGVINDNHQGDFTCTVSDGGVTTQSGTFNLVVTDGVSLSAQGPPTFLGHFIPRNSFIENSSTIITSGSSGVVSCRSDGNNPMWYYSNGTAVTTTTTFNVYQNVPHQHRSDLMIDTATSVNGDYTCTSSVGSAGLGLYLTSGGGTLNPPTNLMSSSVMATRLVVSWTASTSSSVTGYYISWRRTNLGGIAVGEYVQTTGVTYTITNLYAYVPYEISVWSTDGTRVSSPATLQLRTTETAPSAPRLLRVLNSTSCQLDWLPPSSPNGAVTYTVQYQTSGGGNFMDVATGLTATHHTAVNLPSGTSVTLRVRAANNAGMSDSNTAVLQVPTLPQPVSPTALLTSSNTITVSWTAPTVSCPSIDDYIVVYNDGSGNTSVTSTGLTVALSNLQPATTYSLFVAARSNGVAGPSAATSPAMITTSTTSLTSPRNFMATTTTSTSITLSWSSPAQGTVQSYRLTITGGGGPATVPSTSTTHMFSSLTPGTPYMVTIAAVDSMGREGDSSTITVTTNIASPRNFMVTSTTSTAIALSWSTPPQGTVQSYKLTITGGGGPTTVSPSSTTHIFSSLTPFTQYMVTIAAVDSMGREGDSTTPITVTTNLAAPSNVMVTSTTSTSIALSWSPPSQGTVQSYKLTITGGGGPATVSPPDTTHMFSSLTPGTQYMVTIAAVDSMGREGESATTTVTTNLAAPSNFMVTTTTSTSITLTWSPPTQGTVQSYKLTITGGGGPATVLPPSTTHTFSSLTPFTEYVVTIVAVDSMGREGESTTITVTTNLAAPSNFMVTSTTSTSITLTWSPPTQGTVQSYRLTITGGGGPATVSPSSTTHMFSSLIPFTGYMVTIATVDSMDREGDSSTITVTTDRAAPSPPRSLQVVTSSGTSVTLQWTAPAVLGDLSVNYIIDYGEPDTVFTTTSTMFEVTGLASNTEFTFRVRARNSVGTSTAVTVQGSTTDVPQPVSSVSTPQSENSTSVSLSWTRASNASSGTVEGYLLNIMIVGAAGNSLHRNVSVAGQSTTSTTLTSLVPGTPYFVEVQVQESIRGLGLPIQTGVFFSQETDADANAQVSGLTLNMDSTSITWNSIALIEAHHFFNYTITYTLTGSGTQKRQTPMMQTLSYSACTTSCSLTLLELPVDVNYTVTVTITRSTHAGVSVTVLLPGASPTSPPMDTAVVAIVVGIAGAVVVAILIAVFIFCIVCLVRSKKSDYAVGREKAPYIVSNGGKEGYDSSENLVELNDLANEEEREAKVQEHTRIILLEDFPSYVKDMHKDRDAGFEEEYKLLKTSLVARAEFAQKNTHKNRYGNIFAYDHSRVVLQKPDDDGVDYINASYIEGYHSKNCYIATQGPVPSSVDDFWQMVWEQRSPVIVMLTKIEEAGRKKCELYWPEKQGEPLVTDRNVKVTLVGLQHYADFEIRDFHITEEKSDKPLLEVKHFLYTVWPDHGVPKYATSVIKFIRRVRKSYPMSKDNKPIVIHCSAGVGRTGTYICLDVMLQRMNAESNFNVFKFVTAMRSNRTFMVQTMDQYIFIHDAIDELIVCGDTSIPSSNMRIKVNKMHKQLPGKDATVFEHQFELLQSVSHTPQGAEISEALSESNKPKNRDQKYIPYNLSRPRLLSMGIHNGADYINASYVDAYKESNYFILTQSPLHSTIKEFWLTVWQVKSACLVMLCDKDEGKLDACVQFWPRKTGEETLYGKISVTFKSEEESDGFVTRKFEISEEGRNTPPNCVTLLHYCWPDEGCPTDHKPLLKIIGSVEKIQQATGNNPIVVMCQDGTGRSGAFTQIVSQIERMKVEGTVDYFQSIKLARLQRAHLVYSQELYVFCHEFLLSYLDSFEGYSNFEFRRPTK